MIEDFISSSKDRRNFGIGSRVQSTSCDFTRDWHGVVRGMKDGWNDTKWVTVKWDNGHEQTFQAHGVQKEGSRRLEELTGLQSDGR